MSADVAAIESDAGQIERTIRLAALAVEDADAHEEIFVRLTPEYLETPASSPTASQRSFCTFAASQFDRLSAPEPVAALFPVADVLEWLEWFDNQQLRVVFAGEPGASLVGTLRLVGEDREVSIDCLQPPDLLDAVEISLPGRFDGARFLDATGDPVPTVVETTAATLETISTAAERCYSGSYPLGVEDGAIQFELSSNGTIVSATLPATVEGPGFNRQYGPGFGRIARTIQGEVTLQTGPADPLAIVSEREGQVCRYVLTEQ